MVKVHCNKCSHEADLISYKKFCNSQTFCTGFYDFKEKIEKERIHKTTLIGYLSIGLIKKIPFVVVSAHSVYISEDCKTHVLVGCAINENKWQMNTAYFVVENETYFYDLNASFPAIPRNLYKIEFDESVGNRQQAIEIVDRYSGFLNHIVS